MTEIPMERLSDAALEGLVEEFVTREGTDYGHHDHSLDTKKLAVLRQLQRGEAVIVFDPDSESCSIVTRQELR